jgi:O-glycosyl hydrolase
MMKVFSLRLLGLALLGGFAFTTSTCAQASGQLPSGGEAVIASDAILTNPVWGLQQTKADSGVVDMPGSSFGRALHVTIRKSVAESYITQMTVLTNRPVKKGDVMLASLWVRGAASGDQSPARIEFVFQRAQDPWTASVTQGIAAAKNPTVWRRVFVPFQASENYGPLEAMVALRFATQPQTVEVGGLVVVNYGNTRDVDSLVSFIAEQNPLGNTVVSVDRAAPRQTLLGFGGDFCEPRYGSTEPMDVVGAYVLGHLDVVHARVGFPLDYWNPHPGEFRDEAQAHAALLALKEMSDRHIPTVLTVWEGPQWMLPGDPGQSGRVLDPSQYRACIDAITRFLETARDKYGVSVDYFSFNEPDWGVNFKFTPKTMGDFIREAGPRFKEAGLRTKFIVGDTTGGAPFHDFALPLLNDPTISEYLGPLGFHCWDGLTASDAPYRAIAELGRIYKKQVWCLEAGYDSGLWKAPNPWGNWDNGLNLALVYARTLRLSEASVMDYWTYQNNYPLVDKTGPTPYPAFSVLKQMEDVCAPGSRVVSTHTTDDGLQVLATTGPKTSRFAVIIVNPKGPGTVALSGLPPAAKVQVFQSDKTAQDQNMGTRVIGADGILAFPVPARAVVTVVGY